ncbi:hypothetical protein Acsp04_18310 [Actinomadura sp. NBRC 104425]|uniref:hypothetical protein n=1 Tax=Actinomadura sp. NBRC 104425 TaxID=3032204 RepID=UPI0024A2FE11|nr:hypothetical protein [Actinomadura sp. NBRC 104425]GLZ11596.1 hypothetical protein Acsp04_18310 [Actinomadura sp. NBRC 104425]
MIGSEVGRSHFETGAYGFWRAHLRALLTAAGTPAPDALVELLLAPLAPEVHGHQREPPGLPPEQITTAVARRTRTLGPAV